MSLTACMTGLIHCLALALVCVLQCCLQDSLSSIHHQGAAAISLMVERNGDGQ
jgi:hypothetical protein